jgi:signal transduction histidine kinase
MHRPLRQVNQAIALIGAEDLSRRLAVRGQDEFSILATNFNAMLSRLEEAFEQQRRFTADASHELRTPLTVIKVYSSRGLCDPESTEKQRLAWGATDRAATLMNAIVQDLLLLARSDAGQLTPSLQPTSVWADMEAAIEAVQAEGSAPILNTLPRHLMVHGDGVLLTRVFTNLLKNALRHTPTEGKITIKGETKGDLVVVAITDTGTGIPAADLPHILERFYRVDEARSRAGGGGTGLGLAICQSLLHAQGGHLEIDSVLGEGTTVRVLLCLAEPRK